MKIPSDYFSFDLKDTMRLVVWIVIVAFTLGTAYNQRAADLARIDSVSETLRDQIKHETSSRHAEVSELRTRSDRAAVALARQSNVDAQILVSLESIHTELRYVNEKIDVLRSDLRPRK